MISSTSWLSNSERTSLPLPLTCSSPADLAFSSRTAAATSLERTVVFAQRGSVSVVDATYLGWVVTRIWPRSPGAGKDLVGPAAEQERVGAPVDLAHDRPGFVVEVGPSAALECAAFVLLRPAGPLHHSVNGDLRGGRQFHGRSSLLAESVVVRFHLCLGN